MVGVVLGACYGFLVAMVISTSESACVSNDSYSEELPSIPGLVVLTAMVVVRRHAARQITSRVELNVKFYS